MENIKAKGIFDWTPLAYTDGHSGLEDLFGSIRRLNLSYPSVDFGALRHLYGTIKVVLDRASEHECGSTTQYEFKWALPNSLEEVSFRVTRPAVE